jgi:hypothetical protein
MPKVSFELDVKSASPRYRIKVDNKPLLLRVKGVLSRPVKYSRPISFDARAENESFVNAIDGLVECCKKQFPTLDVVHPVSRNDKYETSNVWVLASDYARYANVDGQTIPKPTAAAEGDFILRVDNVNVSCSKSNEFEREQGKLYISLSIYQAIIQPVLRELIDFDSVSNDTSTFTL